MAAALSLVVPGLGQLCQGRVVAAGLLFAFAAVLWTATLGLFGWIGHLIAAIEAAQWRGPKTTTGAEDAAGFKEDFKPTPGRVLVLVVGIVVAALIGIGLAHRPHP